MAYRRKDYYHQRAKELAYRSRAAFKLADLNRKFRLFGKGDYVVDLGAWPGGWLQVIAKAVGPEGRVIGVDLTRIEPLATRNVTVIQADAADVDLPATLLRMLGQKADALLSDMAPKLSGVKPTDAARAEALADLSLGIATRILRPGGKYLCKLFGASAAKEFALQAKGHFTTVRLSRPAATRRSSSELYLVGSGYKPTAR